MICGQSFSLLTDPHIPLSIAITDFVTRSALSSLCFENGFDLQGNPYTSHKLKSIAKTSSCRLITCIIVLLLSGDIEENPGPNTVDVYPCGYCELKVDWSDNAVCCDNCSIWFHCSCINIGKSEYSRLNHTSVNWDCFRCCMSNSSTTPYSYNVEVSNSFSALQDDVFLVEKSPTRHSSPHSSSKLNSNAHPSFAHPFRLYIPKGTHHIRHPPLEIHTLFWKT